jgi:hypothetical protein
MVPGVVRRTWLFVGLGLMSSACGATSPGATRATGSNDAGAAAEPPIDAAALPTQCTTPIDQRPEGGTCILGATGYVEDFAGAPLANLVMTFCGGACYGMRSDRAGAFVIPIGDYLNTEDYALHADGRPDHGVDYLRMMKGEPTVISGVTMRLPALPSSDVELPPDGAPASSVTQGDLTLSVPDGTTFKLDDEDCCGVPGGRTLRVAFVPLADAPGYATAANVDAIYVLAPSGAKPSNKLGVTVSNRAALPASAAVELLVLGDDYFSTPPSVGILAVAAAAHVSADGKTIQTEAGEGIGELTWLGVRRKGK